MTVSELRPVRRVMLIFPPMHDIRHVDTMVCPPMGIASLAAHIRDRVEVGLLDCLAEAGVHRVAISEKIERVGLPYDDILARIRAFAPDMVGLSCIFSSQFSCVTEIARRVKQEIDPEMIVVTGGTHPSFLPETTLKHTYIDYVVLGEGELGLERLIDAHNSGGRIEDIDGIAFRTKSGVQ
ncbi:MAG: cobalamin-dependent protein, partial [Thermodesulfobacteriota bacterium]|nr:cobalamin-dependent protein [Thermodesulfobacteriota bacterium]